MARGETRGGGGHRTTSDFGDGLGWGSHPPPTPWAGDTEALARDLAEAVAGPVRFDRGARALYATDASNYRQPPIGVVWPRSVEDVEAVVAVCQRHRAPLLGRGGGTSLAGQCTNHAVVMDFTDNMHRVLEVDPERCLARVEPGTVLDDLRKATKPHGLTFGPDPATHNHCTLGGMIGNNSCGIHSVMAGRTVDNVHSMEVLTADGVRLSVGRTSEEELAAILAGGGRRGEIYRGMREIRDRYGDEIRRRYPSIPRRVSGYNLDELLPENGFHVARVLVGSEGTLATTLEATVELLPARPERVLVLVSYDDVYAAADHVMEILEHGPIGLEGLDQRLITDQQKKGMHPEDLALLPDGGGWLLVEFGADAHEDAAERAHETAAMLRDQSRVVDVQVLSEHEKQQQMWEIRESGLGATARVPGEGDTWPGWEDSAVPPEKMGDYMRDLRKLLERYDYEGAFYGHFGQGCLHTRNTFELTSRAGIEHYRAYIQEAAELAVSYGGCLSGEHGDGQSRAELLPLNYGDEICRAFRELKTLWDPENRMNPGKVVDPYPITANLRLGADYRPARPATHFQFPDDEGSFARATLRCVGVGKCRRTEGGTMCPSYRVTRREEHSTRGRAHLLYEMLQGDVLTDGWQSEEVKEALDLCLACKSCKGDCPVKVDLATYKAEFLSHYYQEHRRPMAAYSMGLVYWVARVASKAPWLANFVTQTPGVRAITQKLGGLTTKRPMPAFASKSFRAWFAEHRKVPADRPGDPRRRVILWPDTFNDNFHPEVCRAALRVLEAAGREVVLPPRPLCCGRPLYDYGMLDLAKRQLRQILETLGPEIEAGVPVVGLEPSCTAVFRDELGALFPHDEQGKRLARQTFTFAELLVDLGNRGEITLPHLDREVLVHRHCHHEAVMGFDADRDVLDRLGVAAELPATGCCGLAGSFGYEEDHYEVSKACGERVLLPAVRAASPDTVILTDGFSCRSQIAQETDRRALHLAQLVEMAFAGDDAEAEREYPERAWAEEHGGWRSLLPGVGLLGLLATAALWWRRRTS